MKKIKRLQIALLVVMTILMALPCAAQSDGGGKKKKRPVKTEQTQSTSQTQQQSQSNKKKTQLSVKISEPDGYINGHGYVDLGLPSGTKWATCNVGASKPSDYGNYYAWGEIIPKDLYEYSNCFDCLDSKGERWGVYKPGGKTEITPTSGHDTARENWGGTWRMPTASELQELNDKCKWKWTKKDSHSGFLVTGPNGNSIFLPAAGYRIGAEFREEGEKVGYWSSSLKEDSYSGDTAYALTIWPRMVFFYGRGNGKSVRAVTE